MNTKKGKLVVIYGPMFSGKTEELLRMIRRAKIANKRVQLFKPEKDNRYSNDKVLPHHLSGMNMKSSKSKHKPSQIEQNSFGEKAINIENPVDIFDHLDPHVNLVAIEEAQFFDISLFNIIRYLNSGSIDVVISLLDQDFRRLPFAIGDSKRSSGDYIAIADTANKLTAICVKCGADAQCSQKLILTKEYANGTPAYIPASFEDDVVKVGTNLENSKISNRHPETIYEARCKDCHEIPDIKEISIHDLKKQYEESKKMISEQNKKHSA